MMIEIEVFQEDVVVNTRVIPGKDGKESRAIHEQTAYAYLGGKFPVEMKIPLDKDQLPYQAGKYTPDNSSYVVNNFGGLELKRFGLSLKSLKD